MLENVHHLSFLKQNRCDLKLNVPLLLVISKILQR